MHDDMATCKKLRLSLECFSFKKNCEKLENPSTAGVEKWETNKK